MTSHHITQLTQTPTLGDNFTQILPNGQVTFRLTIVAGGTHSMLVWRPALATFLDQIFKSNGTDRKSEFSPQVTA